MKRMLNEIFHGFNNVVKLSTYDWINELIYYSVSLSAELHFYDILLRINGNLET